MITKRVKGVATEWSHPLSAEEKKELFGVRCPPEEDRARQEFKAETDTSYLLHRYGVPNVPGEFGVMDFDVSLQSALHAHREAQEAFRRLPAELQAKYGSWERLFAAIQSGEYQPAAASAGGSGDAGGGSPSDSAAGGAGGQSGGSGGSPPP